MLQWQSKEVNNVSVRCVVVFNFMIKLHFGCIFRFALCACTQRYKIIRQLQRGKKMKKIKV